MDKRCTDRACKIESEPHHHGPLTLLSREDTMELESLLSDYRYMLADELRRADTSLWSTAVDGRILRARAMIGMLQEQREETSDGPVPICQECCEPVPMAICPDCGGNVPTSDDPDACPKCGVCHGCGVECADV